MENLIFIVEADLLLHEHTFKKMRKFVKKLDSSNLTIYHYHILEYTAEKDEIHYYSDDFCLFNKSQDLIDRFIKKGYILFNLRDLKKFLSV